MKLPRRAGRKGRVEIVPMIDTMFFLLVFFMMATLSMTVQRGLKVQLPQAGRGSETPPELSTLTLTRDGQVYLDKERMGSPADLDQRLASASARRDSRVVMINADKEVEHGRVVELLDRVRQAGITHVAVAVVPRGAVPAH